MSDRRRDRISVPTIECPFCGETYELNPAAMIDGQIFCSCGALGVAVPRVNWEWLEGETEDDDEGTDNPLG